MRVRTLPLDDVLEVPCRICRAEVGEPCVRAGDADRPDEYRLTVPHLVRHGDAMEAILGRRW